MGKHFLWDPVEDNIIEEFDDAGNTIADYTTEPNLYGDLISQHRDGQSSFYHYDGQGSTVALTNSNGEVTDTYAYSAFGEVASQSGATVNTLQYIGLNQYFRDSDRDLYRVRRRDYRATDGRWLTVDPLWLSDGPNRYSYGKQSPLVMKDPSGLKCDISVRCGPAKGLPIMHCGLYLDTGNGTAALDGTGPPWNEIHDRRDPDEWGSTKFIGAYSNATCKCLFGEVNRWNNLSLRGKLPLCFNSNSTLRCLVGKCGVTIPWEPWLYNPFTRFAQPAGWNCGEKRKWVCVRFGSPYSCPGAPALPGCVEWQVYTEEPPCP